MPAKVPYKISKKADVKAALAPADLEPGADGDEDDEAASQEVPAAGVDGGDGSPPPKKRGSDSRPPSDDQSPRKCLRALVVEGKRFPLSTFGAPIDPTSPVGKYVESEMMSALQLGQMEFLKPMLDELKLADISRLYNMHERTLWSADADKRQAAQLALLEALRSTAAWPGCPYKVTRTHLESLSYWVEEFGPSSPAKRVHAGQQGSIVGVARVPPSGEAAPLSAEAVVNLITTAIAGAGKSATPTRSDVSTEAARKMPPPRVINESTTLVVKAQLMGELPPVVQVPSTQDVAVVYEFLVSARMPPLSALELSVGGRREKPTVGSSRVKKHKHVRAKSRGEEYMLLERYLYAVGWAAAACAGKSFTLTEIDLHSPFRLSVEDPLVVFGQPTDLASRTDEAENDRALDAAAEAPDEEGLAALDEPVTLSFALIGVFPCIVLFCAGCRSSGYAAGLDAEEAAAHVDRVIAELDDELYTNGITLTAAVRRVEKMRLASQCSGTTRQDDSSDDSDDSESYSTPRKSKSQSKSKSKPNGSRGPFPLGHGRGKAPANKANGKVCPYWARGPSQGGTGRGCNKAKGECTHRHNFKDDKEKANYTKRKKG